MKFAGIIAWRPEAEVSRDRQDSWLKSNLSVLQAEAICGTCIYAETDKIREDYEERILARAADFRPFLELFYHERLEEIHGQSTAS